MSSQPIELMPCRCGRHKTIEQYREVHPFEWRPFDRVWDETGRRLVERFRPR